MASLRSNSLALLAIAAFCPGAAWAGDKIEFSVPDQSLTAPVVERVEKETKTETEMAGPPVNRKISDASEMAYTVVVVNSPQRKDGTRTSDSTYGDEDGDVDANGDMDSDHPSNHQGKTDADAATDYSDRRNDDFGSDQSLRSRMEAENSDRAEQANGYRPDEHFGRVYSDSDQDSSWTRDSLQRTLPQEQSVVQRLSTFSHNFFHQGLTGLDRVTSRPWATYDNLNGNDQYAAQQQQQARGLNDPQSSYAAPPTSTGPDSDASQFDDSRRSSGQDSAGGRLTFVPGEFSSVSLNPDAFVRSEIAKSPERLHIQDIPAILPFPNGRAVFCGKLGIRRWGAGRGRKGG